MKPGLNPAAYAQTQGIGWVRYVAHALTAVVFLACAIYLIQSEFGAFSANALDVTVKAASLSYAFVAASFVVAVVVHEFGHAIAGHVAGVVVLGIRVWPVQIVRRYHGVRLELTRMRKPPACTMGMLTPEGDFYRQHFLFALGGPLINLTIAALACCVEMIAAVAGHPAHPLLRVFAAINVLSAITTLLPVGRENPSDGSRLYRAANRHRAPEEDPDYLRYAYARLTQMTPIEPAPATLERWQKGTVPLLRATALSVPFERAISAGDISAVNATYNQLISGLRELGPLAYARCASVIANCTFELVYARLLRGADSADDGEARLAALSWMRRRAPRVQQLRVEAALAWRRGETDRARRFLQHALEEASGDFVASMRHTEIIRLDEFGTRLLSPAKTDA